METFTRKRYRIMFMKENM